MWVKAGRISIGIVFNGRVNALSMEEFVKVNMMRNKEKKVSDLDHAVERVC
jgi:hypothetical protein